MQKANYLKVIALGWLMILLPTACIPIPGISNSNQNELVVFAAASLTDAMTEMAESFEKQNPNTELLLNFASSSQLAAQLREGVSADVFASANENQMQLAIVHERIDPADVQVFVANKLTVIVPKGNPARIAALEDLGNPGVTLLLAVEGVPVREYADQIFSTLADSLQTKIYANLVSEESTVRQVATKIALGEADAGIVYASDITPGIADRVEQVEIPASMNVMADYPIAVIEDSQQKAVANNFIEFVLSESGQAILLKWGFTPVEINAAH